MLFTTARIKTSIIIWTLIIFSTPSLRAQTDTSTKVIKEVIVNSSSTSNTKTLTTGRGNISIMDLPQTVGTVNSTVIADQQAIRVGEVIRNVSGVSLTQTRLNVNETYAARGYSIGITGGAGSILKNGLVSNIAGMPEAATLESVEVMKGSTSLLYGNVSGGLIVNLMTKKPKFDYGAEIKMQIGSNQQYKPILDLYGPISKRLAFRIVGTYENDKSFRDKVKTERTYINPSLLFKFSEKTSLLVLADMLTAHLTPDFGIGTLDSGRIISKAIPVSRYFNVDWAYNNVKQQSASFIFNHIFNDSWQISFSGLSQKTDVNSYGAGLPTTVSNTGDWNRTLARAHSIEEDFTTQVSLNGRFQTAKLAHQLLIGTDLTRIITKTDAFRITSNGTVLNVYDKINFLNPSAYTARTDIPDAAVTTITTAPSNRTGIFIQDLISISAHLKVLAGLRWSYQETIRTNIFTSNTQVSTKGATATAFNNALSPKFALVFQPSKANSIFASYSNNFSINTGTDIFGQQLTPSTIDQYEAGIKNNFWKDKFSANFSIYRIINSNLAQQAEFRADGTVNADATVKELKGQTTSDGFEIDLSGNLLSDFYFIAGYSLNHMRFTRTSGAKGSNIEGERLVNNPAQTANFSAFYTFRKNLRGLKFGLSAYYTGKRLGGYNNTIGQSQLGSRLLNLQGFTTVDLSAAYQRQHLILQAKLSNIFNTINYLVHDNYSIAPITPRQLTITIGYRFRKKSNDLLAKR